MTINLYGIPNCDTVKKARTWLSNNGTDFVFHDFKKDGITRELIAGWLRDVPSVIKRPVLVKNKKTTVGFSADLYQQIFQD